MTSFGQIAPPGGQFKKLYPIFLRPIGVPLILKLNQESNMQMDAMDHETKVEKTVTTCTFAQLCLQMR